MNQIACENKIMWQLISQSDKFMTLNFLHKFVTRYNKVFM